MWACLLCISADYVDCGIVLVNVCGDFIFYRGLAGAGNLFYVGILASICKKDFPLAIVGVYDLDVYQRHNYCLDMYSYLAADTVSRRNYGDSLEC